VPSRSSASDARAPRLHDADSHRAMISFVRRAGSPARELGPGLASGDAWFLSFRALDSWKTRLGPGSAFAPDLRYSPSCAGRGRQDKARPCSQWVNLHRRLIPWGLSMEVPCFFLHSRLDAHHRRLRLPTSRPRRPHWGQRAPLRPVWFLSARHHLSRASPPPSLSRVELRATSWSSWRDSRGLARVHAPR